MELTCITLWQPWASWIMLGWKTIETRTHAQFAHLVGKRIGIHAGLGWDHGAIAAAAPWLSLAQQHMSDELRSIRGALLGTVHIEHHNRCQQYDGARALIECVSRPRYGLFLSAVKPLAEPMPTRGYQGTWSLQLPGFTMCKRCGCTEENACVTNGVPCSWVSDDLCSACIEPQSN